MVWGYPGIERFAFNPRLFLIIPYGKRTLSLISLISFIILISRIRRGWGLVSRLGEFFLILHNGVQVFLKTGIFQEDVWHFACEHFPDVVWLQG